MITGPSLGAALVDIQNFRRFLKLRALYPIQLQAAQKIESLVRSRTPDTLAIMFTRQFGKNEIEATAEHRAFYLNQIRGGSWIRTAPTAKPQLVFSKARLEKSLACDPILKGRVLPREGFIYKFGNVEILFLSTDPTANVVGGTASLALSIDEAHKVDEEKYHEDFEPMAGFAGVPRIFFGVASDGSTLLEKTVEYNLERRRPDLVIKCDANMASELRPEYARHFRAVVDRLGLDHPIVLTQYLLIPFAKTGGFMKKRQIDSVLASDFDRVLVPEPFRVRFATLDIAGSSEISETGFEIQNENQDSSVLSIFEIDFTQTKNDWPRSRLIQVYIYRGDKLESQQDTIEKLMRYWNVSAWIGDARGIGEQMVTSLADRISGGIVYKATVESVSEDCFGFLALVNNGQFQVFRPDNSPEYAEIVRQLNHTSYKINAGDRINITKPAADKHIDVVKSFTYLTRLIKTQRGLSVTDFINSLDSVYVGDTFEASKL